LRELKCNNCGGTDILLKENGRFVCEYCGVTYTKDQIDKMGMQIDLKVALETGLSVEKYIKNGETWLKLGENRKAREVFEKTVDEYPMDYRGWYGLAKSYLNEGREPEGNLLRNFVLTAPDDVFEVICAACDAVKEKAEARLAKERRTKEEEEWKRREEGDRKRKEEEARKKERQKALQIVQEQENRKAIEERNRSKKKKAVGIFILIFSLIIAIFAYLHSQRPELFEWLSSSHRSVVSNKAAVVPKKVETVKQASPEMVRVRKGSFLLGNTRNDSEGYEDEKPVHTVNLTYEYWIGKYEVTFNDYDAYCAATGKGKPNDQGWGRGRRPIINVSWWEAIAYCNWLSQTEGLKKAYDGNGNLLDRNGNRTTDITKVEGYRLPTEAEWEYAARGGQNTKGYKYAGSNDLNEVGWYWDNSGKKTQSVGGKKGNELGLYDMSGNVWEWCHDWWGSYGGGPQTNPTGPNSGAYRVLRGGGWDYGAQRCRVAGRGSYSPARGSDPLGFRLSRTVL